MIRTPVVHSFSLITHPLKAHTSSLRECELCTIVSFQFHMGGHLIKIWLKTGLHVLVNVPRNKVPRLLPDPAFDYLLYAKTESYMQ